MFPIMLLSLLVLQYGPLNIDVWVDKEEAIYYTTENLKVFFRTDQDCYVAVYDIEVGGREYLLFPLEGEDGWVEAGKTYELPSETADYDYVLSGPEGIETIIVVGSKARLPDLNDEGPDIVREAIEIFVKEPEPGKLRIISTPENCRIYITEIESDDQEYIGKAPRTIVLRPGEYIVKIKKLGYRTLTRRIWLEPGEPRRMFVKLRRY
ncbi:DUF4384 domain-containing protein [candidate division WOR-3 bacterium]|nr:DUF4384 domain-containing protein [candidate division WOR-3 bacterium]